MQKKGANSVVSNVRRNRVSPSGLSVDGCVVVVGNKSQRRGIKAKYELASWLNESAMAGRIHDPYYMLPIRGGLSRYSTTPVRWPAFV